MAGAKLGHVIASRDDGWFLKRRWRQPSVERVLLHVLLTDYGSLDMGI